MYSFKSRSTRYYLQLLALTGVLVETSKALVWAHPENRSVAGHLVHEDGGRVMMQAGGNPGMAIDIGESPLFQQDLAGEEIPLPTPVPTATPQPTQFQPEIGKIDIAESPLFQEHLKEDQMAPEGDLKAPTEGVGTTPAGKEKPLATTFTREYAPVWDISGPEPKLTTIPHEDVMNGIASGKYAFDKAASVPMKFADGEVIPVPADKVQEALGHQMTYATPKDIAQFKYGDQTGVAFAEGLARGILGPMAQMIEVGLGISTSEAIEGREIVGPWHFIGTLTSRSIALLGLAFLIFRKQLARFRSQVHSIVNDRQKLGSAFLVLGGMAFTVFLISINTFLGLASGFISIGLFLKKRHKATKQSENHSPEKSE